MDIEDSKCMGTVVYVVIYCKFRVVKLYIILQNSKKRLFDSASVYSLIYAQAGVFCPRTPREGPALLQLRRNEIRRLVLPVQDKGTEPAPRPLIFPA